MDLVDVKRTPADKEAEAKRWDSPEAVDDYPYGLSIHLDDETMSKLGLTEKDFDAGQPVKVLAEGIISEDSIRTVGGKTKRSMSIQFRKLAVDQEGGDGGPDVATALYGE